MELGWFILILTLRTTQWVGAKTIPSYMHICHRSDPKLNECVSSTVESLRDKLIEGIPELGVPSIEPLHMEEPISTQGVGFTVTTKDLKAYGGGNFTIKSINVDLEKYNFQFDLGFSHLSLEGQYEVNGKIIMIPIRGNGNLHCDVYDVDAKIALQGKLENFNGQDELRFTSMTADVNVENGKVLLGNLFGGDKLIGDVINAAINLNFKYFVSELKPVIQDTLAHFIVKTANNVCSGLKFDDLAPL